MDQIVHRLFEQRVTESPNAPAVVSDDGTMTYLDLNVLANRIAFFLRKQGIANEGLVGIHACNSPYMVAALLGVLKAGAAFVPLDPSFPYERLAYMVADARIQFVLTAEDFRGPSSAEVLQIAAIQELETGPTIGNLDGFTEADHSACVIYTSGSTGRPKGVVRAHQGITTRLEWVTYSDDDLFCHNMSLCYGFSQERLFIPLMLGLPLVVLSEAATSSVALLAEAIAQFGITRITVVPPVLEQMVSLPSRARSSLGTLREIAVGGAELSRHLICEFVRAIPHAHLINAYGTAEAGSAIRGTVSVLKEDEPVSIGRPVNGSVVYILDDNLEAISQGEIGELCIGGKSIARGYLNRPDLDAERFIEVPFGTGRIYRTGDLARFLPDGRIELRGRRDRQMKVRGYRVELGEVEAALSAHPDTQEVVVTGDGDRLIAYVVTRSDAIFNSTQLRRFLFDHLPDYMIPSVFVYLDVIPRTPNGKVSYATLPAPPRTRPDIETPYIEPCGEIETAVAAIWARFLDLDRVGALDEFLELGGDSLLAVKITSEIESDLRLQLSPVSVFECATVAALASQLKQLRPPTFTSL